MMSYTTYLELVIYDPRRGDRNDPFLEADRRETAKQEAAARRVHPTLHLPANSQPSTQVAGLFASLATPGTSTARQSSTVQSASSGSGSSLFATPSAATSSSSLFSTPTTSAPLSLFGSSSSGASPQTTLFGSLATSTPAFGSTAPLFGSTPSAGGSTFATPFASGAVTGSGASFGTASKPRAKSRTSRR